MRPTTAGTRKEDQIGLFLVFLLSPGCGIARPSPGLVSRGHTPELPGRYQATNIRPGSGGVKKEKGAQSEPGSRSKKLTVTVMITDTGTPPSNVGL
jgi:hypothetical protein